MLGQSDVGKDSPHALAVSGTGVVLEDNVHFLEGLVAGFGDEEEHPEEHEETEGSEEDVRAELQGGEHVGRYLANDEVHHVIAADDDAYGLATVAG